MRTTTLAIMEPGSDWRHWSSERMPMSWPLGSFRYARVLAPASTLRPRIVPKAPALAANDIESSASCPETRSRPKSRSA
jgi:hypothetical protein